MGGPSGGGGGGNDRSSANNTPPSKRKYSVSGTLADPREKDDTAAKMNLFHNDPYTRKQGGPIMLRPLEPFFDKTAKATREFFTSKVLESKRAKKNIGYTKDEFSKLSRTKQEEVYKGYMDKRMSNVTDAYGNNLSNLGQDDRYSNKDLNKSMAQPKASSQMDNTGVKSNLITADKTSPTTAEMSEDKNMIDVKRRGRKATMLTSDLNENTKPTLSKKVLLGA